MKKINFIQCEIKLQFIFKILFLIYMFSQSIVIFHRTIIVKCGLWSMLSVGILVCLLRLCRIKDFIKAKGFIWLVLFLFSYMVSIICNRQYGIGADFANLVILGLAVFVIYVPEVGINKIQTKKEMQIIAKIFIAVLNISIVASLVMLMIGYGDIWYYEDYILQVGIIENRLWGVFTVPNLAAIYSVVSVGLCLYFWDTTRNKIYYIVTILLDGLYLAFSDSRTGTVCLFVFAVFVSFMFLQRFCKIAKNYIVRFIVCALVSLVMAGFFAAIPTQIQKVYNYVLINLEIENGDDEKVIKREYDLSQDVTNKRLEIWKSGMEIFMSKPITGVGFHHIKAYAKSELPDTYLATHTGNFSHIHNEFLNILVSQGILGMIPFIIFVISSFISILGKYLKLLEEDYKKYTILLGCLITICAGIVLNEGVLYHYTPNALMFWLILSYVRNVETD